MRRVTCSMGVSLDGYVVGPDGGFDWGAPDDELFRFAIDQIREVDVHFLGRRLYEAMLYWEDVDRATLGEAELEWTALWTALPKVVFSRTLTAVRGSNTRLAAEGPGEEIARWRGRPGEGGIAIGGAALAAGIAALGLVDEYRPKVYPVLVGGGTPFFPQHEHRVDLELVETRTFPSQVVYSRYRRKG